MWDCVLSIGNTISNIIIAVTSMIITRYTYIAIKKSRKNVINIDSTTISFEPSNIDYWYFGLRIEKYDGMIREMKVKLDEKFSYLKHWGTSENFKNWGDNMFTLNNVTTSDNIVICFTLEKQKSKIQYNLLEEHRDISKLLTYQTDNTQLEIGNLKIAKFYLDAKRETD